MQIVNVYVVAGDMPRCETEDLDPIASLIQKGFGEFGIEGVELLDSRLVPLPVGSDRTLGRGGVPEVPLVRTRAPQAQ